MVLGIFCAGSLGREVFDVIRQGEVISRWDDILFIDDVTEEETVFQQPVLRYEEMKKRFSPEEIELVIASGEPYYRKLLSEKVRNDGYELTSIVCKSAYVGWGGQLKKGCIVFQHVYIGNHANLAPNVVVHAGAKVESNCKVGEDTFVSLGAFVGADTIVGKTVFIGPNATLRDHIHIGDDAVVGMGSVVVSDVEKQLVVVGNPAKELGENTRRTVFVKKDNTAEKS